MNKPKRFSDFAEEASPMDGNRYVLFTGSSVLIEQMEKYKDEVPFLTTIKKVDRYYTFS
jgi:hypothetical protein